MDVTRSAKLSRHPYTVPVGRGTVCWGTGAGVRILTSVSGRGRAVRGVPTPRDPTTVPVFQATSLSLTDGAARLRVGIDEA